MSALTEFLRIVSCMRNEPFSLNRYQEVFLPSLERLLPWRSTRLPSSCESWQDVANQFFCRCVIYNDNLIQRHPRLLNKCEHFSEIYDGNHVYMTLNAVRPDIWSEQAVELIMAEKSNPSGIMYSRVVEHAVALKVQYVFPTMSAHLSENTHLLEVQAQKIEKDQIDLQKQYFQKDYNVIERKPCEYNLRSVRESFMAALPSDERRVDQVITQKIPEAMANCVEYDRLAKFRDDEFQRCLAYEKERATQAINNLMTHLNEHFFVEVNSPNHTSFRRYCCHLQFEHYRMLLNNAEMFVESNKSVLRQAMDLEASAYADRISQSSFGPVSALVNVNTGLLTSETVRSEQEDLEVEQIMEQIEGRGDMVQMNMPRRVAQNVLYTPLDWESIHAMQALSTDDPPSDPEHE